VFVGNDFLPNLIDLHIHENGLEGLFDVYKTVLPRLSKFLVPIFFLDFWLLGCLGHVIDGYINESGKINTTRLQVVLDEMAFWEREVFEKECSDLNWYKGKQVKHVEATEKDKQQVVLGTGFFIYPFPHIYSSFSKLNGNDV
jgi:5'-3' exoribonuclease 1